MLRGAGVSQEWCWSDDGERFHGRHPDRDSAIQEAIDEMNLEPGDCLYLAEVNPINTNDIVGSIFADDLLDRMRDAAMERAGEVAEDWPPHLGTAERQLEEVVHAAIAKWIDENFPITFYGIKNEKSILIMKDGTWAVHSETREEI